MQSLIIVGLLLLVSILTQTKVDKLGIMIQYNFGHTVEFKQFLQSLNNPKCNIIQEINVITKSESYQEIQNLKRELSNKPDEIPVNFYINKQPNSFKYRIPLNSKAQIFYIANANFTTQNCQKIEKARTIAEQKMIGSLLGLIGQADSTSTVAGDLTKKQHEVFTYSQKESQHFSIVENIRIIHRHFLQIAASNISEIVSMAKLMSPSCEEIFLNFVTNHFYPELRPSIFPFDDHTQKPSSALAQQKTMCVRKFVGVLGYLPVFYQRQYFESRIWTNPNIQKIIELKKLQLIGQLQNSTPRTRRLQSANQPISTSKNFQQPQSLQQYQQLILNVLWYIVYSLLFVILVLSIKYKYHNYQPKCIKKSVNYI